MRRAFTNARLVLPGQNEPQNGTLTVAGDHIVAAGDPVPADESIDCKGALLAPGIVDFSVFAIDKPAFRFGGITRAGLMPDQHVVLDQPGVVKFRASEGKPDLWSHPFAAATKGLEGTSLAEIALMKQAGARAVATGRQWIADSGLMLKLLQYAQALDLIVIAHAEDAAMVGDAVATAGETATLLGLSSAPACAEAMAISRDLALVRECGAPLHFRQVTTRSGLDLVRQAKAEGLPVTCGITPAHLFLSDNEVSGFRTFARLSPPLRSQDDREACLEALADGTIDLITSSHDPRGPEDKRLPFAEAKPGMAGAETLLPLALNLVREGHIGMGRMFELIASTPARLLGVEAGMLQPGHEADFILVDEDRPWQVDARRMAGKAGNTPFDRLPVQGKVIATYKGGTTH